MTTTTLTTTPSIYVASLSDYNAGILHGRWIDCTNGSDIVWGEIRTMLATSPAALRYVDVAEEFAVHDYEGFGPYRVGEYSDIDQLVAIAEAAEERGPAVLAFASIMDEAGVTLEQFEACYHGGWDSFTEFAEDLFDSCYSEEVAAADASQYLTVNYSGFARDIQGDYYTIEADDVVYVFDTNAV